MATETGVTVIEDTGRAIGIARTPDETLAAAKVAAVALKKIVDSDPEPVRMGGHTYLKFEHWQTMGQFYNTGVQTFDALPCDVDGVKGAKAKANVINLLTGEVIGTAEAYCMRDEPKWSTRPKYEWTGQGKERKKVLIGQEPVPWYQLASMAQTRAGSKALRNRLAWVVVLAGYKTTPAEELGDVDAGEDEAPGDGDHFCKTHSTPYIRRENAKGVWYSHKTADGWCTEPAEPAQEAKSTPPAAQGVQPGPGAAEAAPDPAQSMPDIDVPALHKAAVDLGWGPLKLATFIMNTVNVDEERLAKLKKVKGMAPAMALLTVEERAKVAPALMEMAALR